MNSICLTELGKPAGEVQELKLDLIKQILAYQDHMSLW